MKNLPAFSIRSWDKTEEVFSLAAWREQEQALSLLDAAHSPKILKLVLPQLDQKGWRYITNPFPDAQPVRMEAIRLLCPPCRANAHEAAKINAPVAPAPLPYYPSVSAACEWEKVWVHHGGEVLWPKPDDAPALRNLVEQFLVRKRKEYETRKQKLAALTVGDFQLLQIAGQIDGPFAILPADSITLRRYVREESLHLDFEIGQPLSETMIGCGDASFPPPRLSIEREYSDLVCSYLRENWARKHGLDLAAMEQARSSFMELVRKHAANVLENVPPAFDWQDLISGRKQESTAQRQALQLTTQEELVICAKVCHALIFSDGSRVWLGSSRLRPAHAIEEAEFDACLGQGEAGRLEAIVPRLAAERKNLEALPANLATESQRIEAAAGQLEAKSGALSEVIAPLNRLYSAIELAEIRKQAIGQAVPDLIADWVLSEFMRSDPPRLPTKGDIFNSCGPGTLIGKKLVLAGFGISKQTFARHLTEIRRLLTARGWLARKTSGQPPLDSGKTRKRDSNLQTDDRLEDFNQPTPAESAEDRDEERQTPGSDDRDEDGQGGRRRFSQQ